jgi:diacylglycerol kinase (ATP)
LIRKHLIAKKGNTFMSRRIQVVINPASGQPQPILNTLNSIFHPLGIDWDVLITKESGDAERLARQAAASGVDVVAAYGGDGTVMEVAQGLFGSDTPLAILPGGTANLMSVELGVPKNLAQAAAIAADPKSRVRMVDAGLFGGQTHFLLRVGLGFAARKVEIADRDLKDRFGIMAYSIGALKALGSTETANYRLTLDGQEYETQGFTCLVDNAGNIGFAGLGLKSILVDDGLLDVIIVRDRRIRSWIAAGAGLSGTKLNPEYVLHWQAREITIEADPPQPVQMDGEMVGETPVSIRVVPGLVRVLTSA